MIFMSMFYFCNFYCDGYDFDRFMKVYLFLQLYVIRNFVGEFMIFFLDLEVVKVLNIVLFIGYYGLQYWDIFDGYLCLIVLGWADYLYYLVDFLVVGGFLLRGKDICILDIGIGVNLIYVIFGQCIYDWFVLGMEVDLFVLKIVKVLIGINLVL